MSRKKEGETENTPLEHDKLLGTTLLDPEKTDPYSLKRVAPVPSGEKWTERPASVWGGEKVGIPALSIKDPFSRTTKVDKEKSRTS